MPSGTFSKDRLTEMTKDSDLKKCGVGEKYCICPKFPCHRPNKHLTWFTFAGESFPIASSGDIDLGDPLIKAEVVMTILQAKQEQEIKKVFEVADKTIAEAKTAIIEGKKLLGGW